MTEAGIEYWQGWIGREERTSDVLTPELAKRFLATVGEAGDTSVGAVAPALIHWCLAQPTVARDELGVDGHPKKGGFLPPVDLPRRMWAGGKLEILAPFHIGDTVERLSRISDVKEKTGRTGRLCFVTVTHELRVEDAPVLREVHDIVYREAATGKSVPSGEQAPRGDANAELVVDPTLLFRYSALTFNGHRIHYDRPYATEVEHYAGLVVHGPLQATLLYNFAATQRGTRPSGFRFRGVSPLCQGPMLLNAAPANDGALSLWTAAPDGPIAMQAEACWS